MTERMEHKAIAIHGGAGGIPQNEEALKNVALQMRALDRIANRSWRKLSSGMSALEVAVNTVVHLEHARPFNAGYGASLNEKGNVSLDAGIADGHTEMFASVIGATRTPYPSRLAYHLLKSAKHKIYAGEGADAKAELYNKQYGLKLVDSPDKLITPYRRLRWDQWKKDQDALQIGDTVGVVVFDGEYVATCSSTGGTTGKELGRVGDVPIYSAGMYAITEGAACATGQGEKILEQFTARTVIEDMMESFSHQYDDPRSAAQLAAINTVTELEERFRGRGGVILVQHGGDIGVAHTSDTIMPHAIMKTGMKQPEVRTRVPRE